MGYGWYKLIKGIREAKYVKAIQDSIRLGLRTQIIRHGRSDKPSANANDRSCSELAREKMWARIHLIPLLQAEEDRDQVRRYWADQKREKELIGENTKVYNNERYVSGGCTKLLRNVWILTESQPVHAANICRVSCAVEIVV